MISHSEVKKSKFITYLIPVTTEAEAKEHLVSIRKEHPKANHHCSAMVIDDLVRSNDDGEPASTAGLPMLMALQGQEMNHVLAVVVRYFGGTLLGKGGLVKAYGHAVSEAIEQADLYVPQDLDIYEIVCPFSVMSLVETKLNDKAIIIDRDFSELAHFTLEVTDNSIIDELVDLSQGQIKAEFIETQTRLVSIKTT